LILVLIYPEALGPLLTELYPDHIPLGMFRMVLQALFSVYNGGAQTVENNKNLTHHFNARKASLASRVPSFCSNIRANLARIVNETDVTQAYLEW
jgi:hypothetical protein